MEVGTDVFAVVQIEGEFLHFLRVERVKVLEEIEAVVGGTLPQIGPHRGNALDLFQSEIAALFVPHFRRIRLAVRALLFTGFWGVW